MRKKRYFQNIYKFEDKSKHYLIDVSLDDYDDVYDNWDPSPFKRRDIEDEFHDFILNSSEDIPLNFDLTIILYLPSSKRDTHKESALISAYQNYYNYALARLNKGKKSLQRKIISSLLFAALFLSVGYFWGNRVPGVFFNVLHEGIYIGGWVFLWDFFTHVFITRREQQEEYKLYNRLYHAELRFIYQESVR